tara:strand:- start:68 stop:397 length:330 start_codon:yes stop_codon:yes gene_type:complete
MSQSIDLSLVFDHERVFSTGLILIRFVLKNSKISINPLAAFFAIPRVLLSKTVASKVGLHLMNFSFPYQNALFGKKAFSSKNLKASLPSLQRGREAGPFLNFKRRLIFV